MVYQRLPESSLPSAVLELAELYYVYTQDVAQGTGCGALASVAGCGAGHVILRLTRFHSTFAPPLQRWQALRRLLYLQQRPTTHHPYHGAVNGANTDTTRQRQAPDVG